MIIIQDLYLLSQLELKSDGTNFLFSSSRPGICQLYMKFPHVTNLQHPTKTHCVWGEGKKCSKQFLIDCGEIIHACSKAFV